MKFFYAEWKHLLRIPARGHRTVEEGNLGYYVVTDRDPSLQAVTVIKELVPKAIIPLVANTFFAENDEAVPMEHSIDVDFAATYGEVFASLNGLESFRVLYARGSDVSVSFPAVL